MTRNKKGKVYLVGAGPGDPGLITLKGRECLSEADVVVYDFLANPSFLEYADENAERIYVGKKGGSHTMEQDEINALIVQKTLEGKTVVRLKGGDPFIFGRGGEEALELKKAGVDFEVVPGITSAIAVPAYAGIPLTHREYASSVTFITGHEDPAKTESDIDWQHLSATKGTLVFLMGVGNLKYIMEILMAHGRSPDTPVAVIRRGTISEQTTLVGRISDISRRAEKSNIRPPAVIVVGDVVLLRERLNWFETLPLFGKKIVVTRAREQASDFLKTLYLLGADCIEFPTIKVIPPDSWDSLDSAVSRVDTYDWLVFTSVNGVRYFLERLDFNERDVRDLKGIKIGAIGPKTAEAWYNLGIRPDLVPDEYRAEAVVECFRRHELQEKKILLPRAADAREVLPEELKKMGAHVDVVPAYQTVMPDQDKGRLRKMLENGSIDMITFTSSSTVLNFVEMFKAEGDLLKEWMKNVNVACIGPITARTAEEKGFVVRIIPTAYTIEDLTRSIVQYFSKEESKS